MKFARATGLAVIFLVLLCLHFWLRPVLGWRAGIDFLVIAVLLIAVRVRPGTAALIGCAAGLIADAMVPASFGAASLAMTLVAGFASWLKSTFFADNLALTAIFLFAGKLAFDFAFLLLEGRLGGTALLSQLIIWSTLAGFTTAIAGVITLLVFRPLLRTARELA
ncbi:MAG TPA: rod shape-determining protein MreD [Gemmatimonadaceae bacterium]|nr:rod shape-determining protein MreD [Gemmatimonadaceae bacterium]